MSTNDDPNGRLADFGNLKNGLTGATDGYRHDWVDLTPYAGQTIQLRLRYLTDAAFQERGWFADDFSVTADGTSVWSDDVESGNNGWTPVVATQNGTTGQGWIRTSGTLEFEQYYLAEWRNFSGFDRGLRYEVACNRFGFQWGPRKFTDAIGWYPGYEYRPDLDPDDPLFFRDFDASVVVPSKGNEIYSTRITDKNGRVLPDRLGIGLGGGHVTGSGNPADGRPAGDGGTPATAADLSLGVGLTVTSASPKAARVIVRPGHPAP